ncbi:hypothetical protein UA24_09615 [Marinomonas sp. BSi20414]|nr:hypothetical protein [Marinomonas sp. BSi20414]
MLNELGLVLLLLVIDTSSVFQLVFWNHCNLSLWVIVYKDAIYSIFYPFCDLLVIDRDVKITIFGLFERKNVIFGRSIHIHRLISMERGGG